MKQNRPPPAYQEYAAAMLANRGFRTLSLAERGLLYTMRLECWANSEVPSHPERLARVLGFPPAEITSLLPSVMPFFKREGESLISPELENYRTYLNSYRARQAEGGRKSAANQKARRQVSSTNLSQTESDSSSRLQPTCKSPVGKLQVLSSDQFSSDKSNTTQSIEKGDLVTDDPWLEDYKRYELASNGS